RNDAPTPASSPRVLRITTCVWVSLITGMAGSLFSRRAHHGFNLLFFASLHGFGAHAGNTASHWSGTMKKSRLVMVGNGMAGVRTIEELLKVAPDLYDITVFG